MMGFELELVRRLSIRCLFSSAHNTGVVPALPPTLEFTAKQHIGMLRQMVIAHK